MKLHIFIQLTIFIVMPFIFYLFKNTLLNFGFHKALADGLVKIFQQFCFC